MGHVDSKPPVANSGGWGRFAVLGVIAVIVVVGAMGYQSMRNTRLKDRISQVEGSVAAAETNLAALNSTLSTLADTTTLWEQNTSKALTELAEALDGLQASLAKVSAEIAANNQDTPGNLEQRLQGLLNRTATLESVLQNLGNQVHDLDTVLADAGELEVSYASLNATLNTIASELDGLEDAVQSLTGVTPSTIYEEARNSVVVIRTDLGQGSGFFYSPGLLLTNYHVIDGAASIEVEYYNRQRAQASLVGGDAYADVAIIQVSSSPDIVPLSLANSSQVLVGQQVIAIGNPLGLTGSLSLGYVAQVNKLTDIYPIIVPVLELDITIAPGSSGGPLLDLAGRVIGITNAGTGYGLNFAVPSNIVSRAAGSILATGAYQHPYVGVRLVELTPDYIDSNRVSNVDPFQTGLMVTEVEPGTPAAEAGLQAAVSGPGGIEARDIILAIDRHPILTFEDWAAYVEEHISPGETMLVELWRSGTTATVSITPTSRPPYQG